VGLTLSYFAGRKSRDDPFELFESCLAGHSPSLFGVVSLKSEII